MMSYDGHVIGEVLCCGSVDLFLLLRLDLLVLFDELKVDVLI